MGIWKGNYLNLISINEDEFEEGILGQVKNIYKTKKGEILAILYCRERIVQAEVWVMWGIVRKYKHVNMFSHIVLQF